MAAPGWYEDPNAPGTQRWWDGTRWTEHVAGPAAAAPGASLQQPAREATPYPPARIVVAAVAALFAVLLVVGSAGTWVSVETTGPFHLGASRGGLDRDGAITLGLAILSLILIGVWAARAGPLAARIAIAGVTTFLAFLGVIVAIADLADIGSKGTAIIDYSVGWGLWLCLVAAVALGVSMVVAMATPRLR